ncbi:MAG: hypothetical protein A2451_12445 [Bdellovibrionales bacterium RIFOXYC2_FULL_39_8]|nr:MAG: hypothetical protein A2485_04775 [Bdellovibrionales bacterium RIFOXYC12_FULL_39_17]OFZ69481.1 MAG: hypothetical protein A2451_12445 [Bdellovibrionales bacterium RIFOXYC2_FULL_39_8]HLE12976.1 helix-turn-helix domain-containing protein [Bacteriovoracaceae bacterium]
MGTENNSPQEAIANSCALLTLTEAASYLNIKESRLRMAVFRKEIDYIKLGRLVRFRRNHLEEWINKQTQSAQGESHSLIAGGVLC